MRMKEYSDGCLERMDRKHTSGLDPWFDRLLSLFLKRLDIVHDEVLYLRRWLLFSTRRLTVYIHRITQPDLDRNLHDHPWNSLIVIMRGGYIEETPTGLVSYMAPRIRYMPAEHTHRIALHYRGTTWSLVFCGRHKRTWGFHTEAGWVPWDEYLKKEGK